MTTPLAVAMDVPVAGRVREQVRSKALCRASAGRYLALGIRTWDRSEGSALRLFLSFVAAALMTAATAGLAWKAISHRTDASPAANTQWVAVYTGEYDHGAPVYRFPSVSVIAERNAELAKARREESALDNGTRSNTATRPRE